MYEFEPITVKKDFYRHRHSQRQYLRVTNAGIVLASSPENTEREPALINPDFYSISSAIVDEFSTYETRIILFKSIISIEIDTSRSRIRINYENKYVDLIPWHPDRGIMSEKIILFKNWLQANQFQEDKTIYSKLKAKPNYRLLWIVLSLVLIAGLIQSIKIIFSIN